MRTVQRKLHTFTSYQESITIRLLDARGTVRNQSRGELTWTKPNKLRLTVTSERSNITAVANGYQVFQIDPGAPYAYVLRPESSFPDALNESLAIITGYNAPMVLGLLADNTWLSPHEYPWLATARVVESMNDTPPTRTLVADRTISFGTEARVDATYKLIIAKDNTPREEQWAFACQGQNYTLSIVHEQSAFHPVPRADTFSFRIPANAVRIDRLKDGPGK